MAGGRHVPDQRHDGIQLALRRIYADDRVNATVTDKNKVSEKFGRAVIDTADGLVTVQTSKINEVLQTTNSITHIEGAIGDTQSMTLFGHTIDGDDLTFVAQTVTLTGATPALLSTPLARAECMFVTRTETVIPTGPVQVTVGSGGVVIIEVPAGDVRCRKCQVATAHDEYYLIVEYGVAMNSKNNAAVAATLEIKTTTEGIWFPITWDMYLDSAAQSESVHAESIPLIIPPNCDVRIRADADTNTTDVTAFFHGYLAKVLPD